MTDEISSRKPLFPRSVIIRLPRLMEMKYKPAEIAEALGVNVDTVYRSYLPAGAPYERDTKKNIWIVGTAFEEWALTQIGKAKRKKHIMLAGEAWCLRCNRVTKILKPGRKTVNRYIALIQGTCEHCNGKVNRAISAADAARPAATIPTHLPGLAAGQDEKPA